MRAWAAISRREIPGWHYEFAAEAVVAVARGLTLRDRVGAHVAGLLDEVELGAEVVASSDAEGPALFVAGELWLRGDAFDVGREFYALVGFNAAPAAAWEALVAQVGEERAREISRIATTIPEDLR